MYSVRREWVIWDNWAVSDLSRVIPWMRILRFEHSILWIRVKQRNHSAMAASWHCTEEKCQRIPWSSLMELSISKSIVSSSRYPHPWTFDLFSCAFLDCFWRMCLIVSIILLSNHVMKFFIVRKLVGLVQTMYDYTNTAAIVHKCFNEKSSSEFRFLRLYHIWFMITWQVRNNSAFSWATIWVKILLCLQQP